MTKKQIDQWLKAQGLECDPYRHHVWSAGVNEDIYYVDHVIGDEGVVILGLAMDLKSTHFLKKNLIESSRTNALAMAMTIVLEIREQVQWWKDAGEDGAKHYDNLDEWLEKLRKDLEDR
jgi:hypothetical protein